MPEKLLNHIDLQRDTVISLQRLLVSHPAIGPEFGGQGEREKADALKGFLQTSGLSDIREFHAPDPRVPCGHRPSLALNIKGKDTSRTFWILSHIDVVPVGDESLWHHNPFELLVDGDMMYGRGVEDNHHGLVTSVILAKAIQETGLVPSMNLGLLFVADEETGNKLGIEYLIQNHSDLFKPDDLFLVPDSGLPDSSQIEVAEKGILWLKVTITGKQCHASRPKDGINTLRASAHFIVRLDNLYRQFPLNEPVFDPPTSTFEATRKEENVQNINTVPGRDVFYIDCRVLPRYKLDDVLESIRQIGQGIEADHDVKINYEKVQYNPPAPPTPVDCALVKNLSAAISAEYGTIPQPQGIGGGTMAAILRRQGFETVVWSTIYENPHVPNEKASIPFCLRDAKVISRLLFPD
jgi:succinyl-diaminopimelate desuccinylase